MAMPQYENQHSCHEHKQWNWPFDQPPNLNVAPDFIAFHSRDQSLLPFKFLSSNNVTFFENKFLFVFQQCAV